MNHIFDIYQLFLRSNVLYLHFCIFLFLLQADECRTGTWDPYARRRVNIVSTLAIFKFKV